MSSAEIACCASLISFLTKESTLIVTMLIASFAMSEMCTFPVRSVECTNPAISAISWD